MAATAYENAVLTLSVVCVSQVLIAIFFAMLFTTLCILLFVRLTHYAVIQTHNCYKSIPWFICPLFDYVSCTLAVITVLLMGCFLPAEVMPTLDAIGFFLACCAIGYKLFAEFCRYYCGSRFKVYQIYSPPARHICMILLGYVAWLHVSWDRKYPISGSLSENFKKLVNNYHNIPYYCGY